MPRGTISLVFDDGYEHIRSTVVPLLNARKQPGVFAVPLEGNLLAATEKLPVATWRVWAQTLRAAPVAHELAAHGISHQNLTTLSDERLQQELAEPRRILGASTLVYPGGAHDARVVRQARQHYTAARTVRRRLETRPPHDPLRLTTINWTRRNWSLARANALTLAAWAANRWLIETFHHIDNHSPAVHAVPYDSFVRHLDFLARLPVRVQTIRSVIGTA